jgi:Spy/CpxP family protein refolding chaperone
MFKRYGIPTTYLLIVFLCGTAIGVFGYRFYELRTVAASNTRPSPEQWKRNHMAELQQRLHLTSDQYQQISGILDDTHAKMRVLMDQTRPEMERIQKEQFARVSAVLTPDQMAEYQKLHLDRARRRMRNGPPPPPPQ